MRKVLALLLLALCVPAHALKEYYTLSRSVRSLGMGGAFYGLSDDEYALFYNPAGLSFYRGKWEAMITASAHVAPATVSAISTLSQSTNRPVLEIADELSQFAGRPLYVGAGLFPHYVQKHFAVGVLVADTKADLAILGKEFNTEFDLVAISDSGLFSTYSRSFFDENLHLGLTGKILFRAGGKKTFSILDLAKGSKFKVDPQSLGGTGMGIDFDLGGTYQLPRPLFGLATRFSLVLGNLLATRFPLGRSQGEPPGLPRTVSLGAYSVLDGIWIFDNVHLLLDLAEFQIGGESDADDGARQGGFFKHVNLGVELPIQRWFAFRVGLRQGNPTLGIGIHTPFAKLDAAYYGEEVFNGVGRLTSRRIALTLALGIGDPPPQPVRQKTSVPPRESVDGPREPGTLGPRRTPRRPVPPATRRPGTIPAPQSRGWQLSPPAGPR